jgi:L-amino acid N-acyltransferase YncA
MQTKDDLLYRQPVTLRDGSRVLLRPLAKDDRQALIDLFTSVPPEELPVMRHDISNPEVVGAWVDNLDYDKVLPLVAVLGARIVGDATLHFGQGPYRHIGEVRIYLAKDFRQRGLGTRMLQALIDLARRRGLLMLEVRSIRDNVDHIRAFQSVGFVNKCIFEDAFMLPNGELHDIAHLILRIRPTNDDF